MSKALGRNGLKKYQKIVITMVAIFLWCGMMYPELSFPSEVLMVRDGETNQWRSCTVEEYYDFLAADRDQIVVRSEVAEMLSSIQDALERSK